MDLGSGDVRDALTLAILRWERLLLRALVDLCAIRAKLYDGLIRSPEDLDRALVNADAIFKAVGVAGAELATMLDSWPEYLKSLKGSG